MREALAEAQAKRSFSPLEGFIEKISTPKFFNLINISERKKTAEKLIELLEKIDTTLWEE